MKIKFQNCLIRVTVLCSGLLMGCINTGVFAQANQWAKNIGGNGKDICNDVGVDFAGNVYSTGYFSDTVDFDPGPGVFNLIASGNTDIFVLKLDPLGNFLWAHRFGGDRTGSSPSTTDVGNSIAVEASGNVVISGVFHDTADFDPGPAIFLLSEVIPASNPTMSAGDIFLLKLNASGNFMWAKKMGNWAADKGESLAIDNSGNILVAGEGSDSVDFDPGSGTAWLYQPGLMKYMFACKYTATGGLVWARITGGTAPGGIPSGQIFNKAIAVDPSNNLITTALYSGTIDLDPGPSIDTVQGTSNWNSLVSKINSSGNYIWGKAFIGSGETGIGTPAIDANGNVFLTGGFIDSIDFDPNAGVHMLTNLVAGASDIYVIKLTAAGNLSWVKQIGPSINATFPAGSAGRCAIVDGAGNLCMGGMFQGKVDFDPGPGVYDLDQDSQFDGYMLKLDGAGNFIMAAGFGGNSEDDVSAIAVDGSNNIILGGYFRSAIADFYRPLGRNLTTNNLYNGYITKYNSCLISTSTQSETVCDFYVSPSGNFTWSTSGTHYDLLPAASGCDSILTINLTVLPSPVVVVTASGPTSFCQGDSVVLSVSTPLSGWQWVRSGVELISQTNPTFTAWGTGNYYCIGTDSLGCTDTSNSVFVSVPCMPLGPNQSRETVDSTPVNLQVYPNPSSGAITIMAKPGQIRIYNMEGKMVREFIAKSPETTIDLSEWNSGIYTIRLQTEDQLYDRRFLLR